MADPNNFRQISDKLSARRAHQLIVHKVVPKTNARHKFDNFRGGPFSGCLKTHLLIQNAPKERRRRRAEKRLSKRAVLESPFFYAHFRFTLRTPENLKGAEKKRTLQNHPLGHLKGAEKKRTLLDTTLLDNRFSARRLLRSFDILPDSWATHHLAQLNPQGLTFTQWNPKYGCKGTVTTRFALRALVAWQY